MRRRWKRRNGFDATPPETIRFLGVGIAVPVDFVRLERVWSAMMVREPRHSNAAERQVRARWMRSSSDMSSRDAWMRLTVLDIPLKLKTASRLRVMGVEMVQPYWFRGLLSSSSRLAGIGQDSKDCGVGNAYSDRYLA